VINSLFWLSLWLLVVAINIRIFYWIEGIKPPNIKLGKIKEKITPEHTAR
jgi:hypothetical protein